MKWLFLPAGSLFLAACQAGVDGDGSPGTSPDGFTGIADDEVIIFGGTEPFWGGEVTGDTLIYTTPENIDGDTIAVERFIGQGGISFAGTYGEARFDLAITPGECSDGMSDRTYPYTATLQVGEETREGCAHTDRQPFSGPQNP
ncbi:COG3650 family protein [Parerythrobacter jejuensis]|uniref:Lipoprotein n=1 Tax=Parerythrobacter jejuensis TaxID=795812 RepID=A0A845ATZ8_9SPHN|nr:hypothetical protein [Parerythrobacter jejuensis]MXP30318.1 hypothetical protein [Parerythrobacter jejuensis]MXP33078.1 hypothetical protein [Parerythrobacter jejuensis]